MKVVIEIDLDNAAFDNNMDIEFSRILSELCRSVREHHGVPSAMSLRDINGNTVGSMSVESYYSSRDLEEDEEPPPRDGHYTPEEFREAIKFTEDAEEDEG